MYKNGQEFLKKRYDPIHDRKIKFNYHEEAPSRMGVILSKIKKAETPIKLLDIGCYDGEIGMLLKKKFGKQCQIYAVDSAPNSVKMALKKGIKVKLCDVTQGIVFESNMFDYVFAGEIIEHLYDTDFFLEEIKRVLKPNGILILTTPNFLSFGRRIYYLFGKGIFMESSFILPDRAAGHIRYYTFDSLKELARLHNFEPAMIFSDTVNFPWFRIDLLAKIFPRMGQSIIAFLRNKK